MATLLHQRLSDAAKAGDIDELYVLLQEDSYILDAIDQNPFTSTPLHVAANAGQACFVEEITNLKHSFVTKLNQSGYSPLHLAAANGHLEVVKQLLKIDSCLGQLHGREKRTPLHCAAIAGSIEALDELIFNCNNSLRKKTIQKETALHLALKHGQLETAKALLRWIEELKMESILSWTDQEGNTVLHLATSLRQHQIVKMLCSGFKVRRAANVNARNNDGLTALDLDESVRHPDEELEVQNISNILHKAGSIRACDVKISKLFPSPLAKQTRLAIHRRQRIFHYFNFRVHEDTSLEVRNTLLVILVLIATVTFDVGINVPGGNWQDDIDGQHQAGQPIWKSKDKVGYFIFTAVNFLGFVMSSVMIFRLVEGYPYSGPVQLAQSLLIFTCIWSTPLFPNTSTVNYILITVGIIVTLAILWLHRKPRRFS
ncbi:ankyrin repeat-containing protein BDA1-like isoform X2 [Telopea speciosissima]|uniref:ankyrin repeat-containing protein BDA1-like isoform X2 n=1 Tax=Telopea speciosissima TaxID=54955 RepID=UPI001CC6DC84|nr:ankyrin repeat-containing protein BDA1-like isoform X2 [Telopea speciosissima]